MRPARALAENSGGAWIRNCSARRTRQRQPRGRGGRHARARALPASVVGELQEHMLKAAAISHSLKRDAQFGLPNLREVGMGIGRFTVRN